MEDSYDIVVVGAGTLEFTRLPSSYLTETHTGWHGLVAAKVYLETHPGTKMLVLEAESSCGGTWSANRLYPGLKSNKYVIVAM
jgi:hypothetical protein